MSMCVLLTLKIQLMNGALFLKANLGTFKKYVRSRFPSFAPLPPCSPLFILEHNPPSPPPTCPPPKGTFVLGRTHSLLLNFSTCEILRKEINNEYQYLWLNSTCLLKSHSRISINCTPLMHDKSIHFMETST